MLNLHTKFQLSSCNDEENQTKNYIFGTDESPKNTSMGLTESTYQNRNFLAQFGGEIGVEQSFLKFLLFTSSIYVPYTATKARGTE